MTRSWWKSFFRQFLQPKRGLPSLLAYPQEVPEAQLLDQDGNQVELRSLTRQGVWVLFFYPKANTPGCTAQACSLRDTYESLSELGIGVIGVSSDSVEAQKRFALQRQLPFLLLSDPEGKLRVAMGVKRIPILGVSAREAFLIKNGSIVWHDRSASTHRQAEDILKACQNLEKRSSSDSSLT